jgi:hypothetical protein
MDVPQNPQNPQSPFEKNGKMSNNQVAYPLQLVNPQMIQNNPYSTANISKKLMQPVSNKFIRTRPGPGGQKITYVDGAYVIDQANSVFRFDGWSSQIVHLAEDFVCFLFRFCLFRPLSSFIRSLPQPI